jgi:Arc/MetJ-type ribon-helix-helix transcriptional regulator
MMNVHVSENAERIIRLQVASGKFSSETEVIDAALGILEKGVQEPPARKPATEEEFKQQLLHDGLMLSLPIPLDPATRRHFQPIRLEGEPLSETIIRERR